MGIDAFQEFQFQLEAGDESHPTEGEVYQRSQVMVNPAGNEIEAVGADEIAKKDKRGSGIEQV